MRPFTSQTTFFLFLLVQAFVTQKKPFKYGSSARKRKKTPSKQYFLPNFPPNSLPISVVFTTNCLLSLLQPSIFQGKRTLSGMPVISALPPHGRWCIGAAVKYKQEPLPALIHTTDLTSVGAVGARLRRFTSTAVKMLRIPPACAAPSD